LSNYRQKRTNKVSPETIAATLALVATLETNNGTLKNHEIVRNPASIHYGDAAQGTYGLMPKTLKSLGFSENQEKQAATKLARITLRNAKGCRIAAAVILWEQGHNIKKITAKHWQRGNAQQRLARITKFRRNEAYGKRFF